MQKSFKAMAQRAVNAEAAFIESLMFHGDISEAAATKVASYYLREGIAKVDYGIGRVNIKHGAFLDKAVIRRALAA